MKKTLFILGALALTFSACKKEEGCTDSTALNFDSKAEEDNGTCTYPTVTDTITTDTSTTTSTTSTALEGPKRIKEITSNISASKTSYDYDSEGRLIGEQYHQWSDTYSYLNGKLHQSNHYTSIGGNPDIFTYTYLSNKIAIEKSDMYGGTTITLVADTIYLNDEGLPTAFRRVNQSTYNTGSEDFWTYYYWSDGNIVKSEDSRKEVIVEYDDKINYRRGLVKHQMPSSIEFETKNNAIKSTVTYKSSGNVEISKAVYKYDEFGYPTKSINEAEDIEVYFHYEQY